MKILITYGTRPEFIKVKPVIDEFKKRGLEYKTLFTGQHDMISDQEYDYRFIINNDYLIDRLSNVFSTSLIGLSRILHNNLANITHVLVQGDTTSAVAIAMAAFHNKVKVIHLEAGLRTYDKDNPFPEEVNRRIISEIADIHFCPTLESLLNLRTENITKNCYIVGNTALDSLVEYKNMCEYGDIILITMHRRENHEIMDKWFIELNKLAKKYKYYRFILPIHPNPNVQKFQYLLPNIEVIDPLNHEDLLNLLTKCKLVITDSGGLQEECSFLNKKCLVCRKTTERPEAVGYSSFLVEEPNMLESIFEEHINNYIVNVKCPYGDGKSSEKILNVLYNENN
jgi:UDP-N-acetylglucosamine 2-epimerase (non-hydrolysing)